MRKKIKPAVLIILLVSGCFLRASRAQEDMPLEQRLEKGIVQTQIFHKQKFLVSLQQPVAQKKQMIDFKWQLVEWPFILKYPSNWYVRESYADTSSLFITLEPVSDISDHYKVGMSLHYYPGYFALQKPRNISQLDKIAYDIDYLNQWKETKTQYVARVKQLAQKVISVKNIDLAGKPAVRLEFRINNDQIRSFYIKSGNDLIQMSFQAPAEQFSQYDTVFDLMLDSFYFKN